MHEMPYPLTWPQVQEWRRGQRQRLIARRLAQGVSSRRKLSRVIVDRLLPMVTPYMYPVLGIFWPIRGEVDVRELARRHIAAGGRIVLPVVVTRGAPVEFWSWRPGMTMHRDGGGIPVPLDRASLIPDALIVPLLGFDRNRHRLGLGGGYYDRTLAVADFRPHTIGIASADAELETIHPQPHDIPMHVIVTDQFTLPAARP